MPRLIVHNFSCLDHADVRFGRITILIGPQASGKSVMSKLLYFFAEAFVEIFRSLEELEPYRIFERSLAKRFCQWFPPSTWGAGSFRIEYDAGPVHLCVERKALGKRISDEVAFTASPLIKAIYDDALAEYRKLNRRSNNEDDALLSVRINDYWPIQRQFRRILESELGSDYPTSQMFVPAGRSFYTNLGKAVVILEHGSQLDDITKNFGRVFTSLLDGRHLQYLGDKPSSAVKDFVKYQNKFMDGVFGGEIRLSRNDTHVATPDGRKIPLGMLSSGQQELLPLVLFLKFYTSNLARSRGSKFTHYLFVEEPEAHLFPQSQGSLTQHLVETANFGQGAGRLLITTHSPYVLAKMNNLIQAHLTGAASDQAAEKVSKIIPRSAWLPPEELEAYAIINRDVRSIKDESGLIDASYLDQISNEINDDFMSLLEIENAL